MTPHDQFQSTGSVPRDPNDSGSIGWAILGFFIPIVGLVLWLVWNSSRPNDAKMSRNGFLAAVIVIIVLWILMFIIGIIGVIGANQ